MEAIWLDSQGAAPRFATLERSEIEPQGVLVAVEYSDLNYKDALALTGKGKILRKFPLIPGIDFAGMVVLSTEDGIRAGDKVLCTGHGLSETHNGGYASLARVPADWLIPLPATMSARDAMAFGTAGLTAGLAVQVLESHGVSPDKGPVVVTGSTGGVGTIAVVLLAKAGYHVAAVTGRPENEPLLRRLGAAEVLPREALAELKRPMESERWAGAIDSVGGPMLAGLLASTKRGGCVASCGLAGSAQLGTTVLPFILRGVTLAGVDSVEAPRAAREQSWRRLSEYVPAATIDSLVSEVEFRHLPEAAAGLLEGRRTGRAVVKIPS